MVWIQSTSEADWLIFFLKRVNHINNKSTRRVQTPSRRSRFNDYNFLNLNGDFLSKDTFTIKNFHENVTGFPEI